MGKEEERRKGGWGPFEREQGAYRAVGTHGEGRRGTDPRRGDGIGLRGERCPSGGAGSAGGRSCVRGGGSVRVVRGEGGSGFPVGGNGRPEPVSGDGGARARPGGGWLPHGEPVLVLADAGWWGILAVGRARRVRGWV